MYYESFIYINNKLPFDVTLTNKFTKLFMVLFIFSFYGYSANLLQYLPTQYSNRYRLYSRVHSTIDYKYYYL